MAHFGFWKILTIFQSHLPNHDFWAVLHIFSFFFNFQIFLFVSKSDKKLSCYFCVIEMCVRNVSGENSAQTGIPFI